MSKSEGRQVAPERIREHLNQLTKPPGSLGRLEDLAVRLGVIQQTCHPRVQPRRLVVFAADHGVVASGVSAWPAEVTRLMVANIRSGGAASSVLAEVTRTELTLVNVGTNLPVDETGDVCESRWLPELARDEPAECRQPARPAKRLGIDGTFGAAGAEELAGKGRPSNTIGYRERLVRLGTGNLAREPALTDEEFMAALEVGEEEARRAARDQIQVVAAGEMGIGNSTPAACLAVLLADVPELQAVGRGAGADDATLVRKRQVVQGAVQRARSHARGSIAEMSEIAGLELAAMAGFFLEAHRQGLTIVLDGYIASAAALIAQRLAPRVSDSMIAAHQSAEPGHAGVLQQLGLVPFLDWHLRLGEGTGALMLMPMLDAAVAMMNNMATLADLGMPE